MTQKNLSDANRQKKEERLAAALRQNLKRRKAQARDRQEGADEVRLAGDGGHDLEG